MIRRVIAAASALALVVAAPAFAGPAGPNINSYVSAPSGNVVLSPVVPASLASGGTYTSCVAAASYRAFDVFAALAADATIQAQRYADSGCTQPIGAAVPATALTVTSGGACPGITECGDVGSNDGLPFIALGITVTDTSGATNAITNITLTLGSE